MKLRFNFRFVFLLLLLGAFAIREVALELRPSWLRPGLHLFAYVGNTADGTVSAIDLIKLATVATISVGPGPSGLRSHPTRPEIWGVSSTGGYVWVLDCRSNRVAAQIPVGSEPYALDFSPDGRLVYVAASAAPARLVAAAARRHDARAICRHLRASRPRTNCDLAG